MRDIKLTEEIAFCALRLKNEGVGWNVISRYLGITIHRLRAKLDPEYITARQLTYVGRKMRVDNAVAYAMPKPPLLERDLLLERLRVAGHAYAGGKGK